jgi:hypothetical protein
VVQVDGMDCLAVKQAVKFAKEYALKNGPMVSSFHTCTAISKLTLQSLSPRVSYLLKIKEEMAVVFQAGCFVFFPFSEKCFWREGFGDGHVQVPWSLYVRSRQHVPNS